MALWGSQMGRGNETNFLTEREARPLIQCAGREAGGPSAGIQGETQGGCEAARREVWSCLCEDSKAPREKRARHTGRPSDCHRGSQRGMDETAQARPRQLWATVDLLTQEPVLPFGRQRGG